MPTVEEMATGRAQANTLAKAGFTKSLMAPIGMGGMFAIATGGMEINRQRLLANRDLKQREERYSEEIRTTQGLDDNLKTSLIGSNIDFSRDKLTRHNQGMDKMTDNSVMKSLLIGGGLAASLLIGGPIVGMLGLAAATGGGV
jgi:hypothetical protein